MEQTKIFKHLTANEEKIEVFNFERELSMQAYIWDNENILNLDTDQFNNAVVLNNEVTLSSENVKKRIDLFVKYDESYAIVELKKDEINMETFKQLEGYLQQRKELLKSDDDSNNVEDDSKWIGILIGSTICPELEKNIRDGKCFEIDGEKIPVAGLTLSRFKSSTNNVYVISQTYFKEQEAKNYDKYNFNDKKYTKGRLVLAVIKQYVADNPRITFSELKNKFPDAIHRKAVFVEIKDAKDQITNGRIKHYIKNDELITLEDGTAIAVSCHWGDDSKDGLGNSKDRLGNIKPFIQKAKEYNYKITKV